MAGKKAKRTHQKHTYIHNDDDFFLKCSFSLIMRHLVTVIYVIQR